MAAQALAAARAAGVNPDVVYIPRPSATPAQVAAVEETGTVAPLYTANPAPMGVAYYGLSGTGTEPPTATTLTTTAIQGSVDVNDVRGADLFQAAPDSFSIQLNAVLTGVTLLGNPSYTFWTQDIATYFPSTDTLLLVTNIWNFSGLPISSNALYNTSGSFTSDDSSDYGALGFYYSERTVQGVTEPFDLTLEMQSTVLDIGGTAGLNQLLFGASLTSSSLSFSYPAFDNVIFDSSGMLPYGTVPYGEPAPYTASGTVLNPLDLTDDFELVICGPGGGSNVDLGTADAELGLAYYDASSSSFVPVPAAYSYGGDTGESSIGANVAWSDAPGGPAGLTDYGTMSTGPSILSGLWGTGAPEGTSSLTLSETPANAFNFFLYYGTNSFSTPIVSQYAYAPNLDTNTFYLMPGSWSIRSELSGYSPSVSNFYLGPSGPSSPHSNTLDIYEVAAGGISSESLDPSVCYATVCAEPVANVYETLVTYAGSSSSQLLPLLSTCVPGAGAFSPSSVSCENLYGQSLVVNNPSTGLPEYWTFPIDKNARFYDPSTGASWPVYPSDVMFSFARTMSYANLPQPEVNPGWIQSQALLLPGNPSWDGGIHAPYNNTPSSILGSMLVNDSTYCPASAMAANGCITFVADGGGTDWPFFLQLVAQPLGAGIQSCGWASYEGADLPGFPGTSAAEGDGPCLLPGDATTTSSPDFQNGVKAIGPTGWDSYQLQADNSPAIVPNLRYAMVGSGPYYLALVSSSSSYTLQANPAYAQPNCAGVASCYPDPRTYLPTVDVNWESNDLTGIEEYEAGEADFATISPSDTSTLLLLQSGGKLGFVDTPSFEEFFLPFNLNFNVAGEKSINQTGVLNVPSDFFSSDSLRNFLTHAWPYATVNATLNSIDGVSYGFNYGGPIPQFMGDFYPSNVSFPSTDPDLNSNDVGGAAWWWAQANNPSTPYYDPELATCSASAPCQFPIVGQLGDPTQDSAFALYISEIDSLTGGALEPYTFDLSTGTLYGYAAQGYLPDYSAGWAPDYADPTDYFQPLALPNSGFYTGDDSVSEQLAQSQYNSPLCGHSTFSTTDWSSLTYWANLGPIPSDCQGVAYQVAVSYGTWTDFQPLGSQRVLAYNLVEHILNQLALYTWEDQANEVESYAPWIDPATVNTNPMIGGSGDQLWFNIGEEGYLDIDLPADFSAGVYTPLWAFDTPEVVALSQSGQGTPSDPFVLINQQPAPLSSSFGLYNDYGFPVFPGVFLQDTDSSVELYEPPSFSAYTNDSQSWGDELPQTNDLQYWFWGVSNVALVDAVNISGWFGAEAYSPLYFNSFNVVFYNSEDNLVAGNSFFTASQGLLMYTIFSEPDYNTVWGNQFIQIDPPLGCPASGQCLALLPFEFGLGLEIGEDYDLVYNNLFATPTTAWLLPLNLVTGSPELYPDNLWNIAPESASIINYLVGGTTLSTQANPESGFPTIPLTGSIVGGLTQGGNSWWDQGVALNWDNGAVNTNPTVYDENAPTLLDPLSGYPTYAVALMSTYSCDPSASYTSVPKGDYYCMTYIYGTTGGDNAPLTTITASVSFAAQDLTTGGTWGAVLCGPSAKGPGGPSAKGPGGSPSGCGPSAKGPGGIPPGEASSESLLFTEFATSASEVNILAPPGEFYWSIPLSPPGEAAENQLGSFAVTGTPSSPVPPAPVSTTLAPSYMETATESGLPTGSVWWFNVTGRLPLSGTVTPSTNTITSVLPDGTYSYVIRGPSGYSVVAGPATGTITVSGANPPGISVTFSQVTLPLTVSPSAGPNPTEVGALVTFSAGDTGGVAPYTYSWSGLPTGCLNPGDQQSFSCTPTTAGSYTISLAETDPVGEASATFTLTVNAALTITTTSLPNWDVNYAGYSQTLTATGGVGAYTWSLYSGTLPTGLTLSSGGVLSGAPTATGSFTFTLEVTDALGDTATQSFTVVISPSVSAGTASATPNPIDQGQSTTISTTGASGGSGSYTYAWTGLPTGCSSTSATFSCAPTVSGSFSVTLTVTDSLGQKASSTFTLTVDPALVVSPSATPNPVDVDRAMTVSAGASGGSGKYTTYVWSGLPSGCASTAASFVCTPAVGSGGTYAVKVKVTDSNGNTVTGSFTLTVTPATLTVNPTSGVVVSLVTVTGAAYSVNSKITLTFGSIGIPSCLAGSLKTSSSGSFSCTFLVPIVPHGTYTLTATDSSGNSATAAFEVLSALYVVPTSGPPGSLVGFVGTGFATNSVVTVTWSGGLACTAKTTSTGLFACSFTIPKKTVAGTYVFTATDSAGNTATVTFKVT